MNTNAPDTSDFPSHARPAGSGGAPSPDSRNRDVCGDFDIRIDRDGVWYYHGSPIGRKELVRLFSTVLNRDDAGDYWLTTPVESGRVQVDDVPFIAVELFAEDDSPDQVIRLRTNIDDVVTVDGDHPLRVVTDPETGEPSPYVTVRAGLDARIARSVYYELVTMGGEENIGGEKMYGVWSSGHFFALGKLDDGG
jgi:hypothetical protein